MILVFSVKNKDTASWLVVEKKNVLYSHNFDIVRGEDKSLLHLSEMLYNNNLKLEDFKKVLLLVKDASLTQVKVFTTIINTLAWQFDWPVVAEFYFKEDNENMLEKGIRKLNKLKKFKAISPEYSRKAEITLSKKEPKYTIAK